ncbi:hypothetical protein NXW09_28505 [Bacteroides ovatus]|nr:hypothetical protein [Bacteroides ovatus]
MKPKFIEGGRKNGHDPKVLEKIWTDWESLRLTLLISHTLPVTHGSLTRQHLKANYPSEYMAAVSEPKPLSNITDITKLMWTNVRAMGIQTLGPDVNESNLKFTVNHDGNIRFGLGAVKGVGEAAVQSIMEERKKNGPFLANLCATRQPECL